MTNPDQPKASFARPIPTDIAVPDPNQPLPVYSGSISVESSGRVVGGTGTVEIAVLPSPSLFARVEFDSGTDRETIRAMLDRRDDSDVRLHVGGAEVLARWRGGNWGADRPWGSYEIYDHRPVHVSGSASELWFELMNMDHLMGDPVDYGESGWGSDLILLKSSRWHVELQALRHSSSIREQLRESGGYGVTHVGRATRCDGESLTPDSAAELLETVQLALSFACNRWVTPVRPRGKATDGSLAWEYWGLRFTDAWSSPMTWYNKMGPKSLSDVFRAIDDGWCDEYWRRLLQTSMHYHLDSMRGLVNRQMIMAAALIELIGWHVVVEDRQLLSPKGYDRLESSDRVRMLFGLACVDLAIPAQCTELQAYANGVNKSWDVANLVCEVRHSVVHAKRHPDVWKIGPKVWGELLQVTHDLCNLAMLFMLDYQRTYVSEVHSRSTVDDLPVPWAIAAADVAT